MGCFWLNYVGMRSRKDLVVVLHNVRSVHNVGSIFRTADAAGVKKIYLCGITPEPIDKLGNWRKDFLKVSLGAEKSVTWEKCASTASLVNRLKMDGYYVFAIEQDVKATPLNQVKPRDKAALIMGSEVKGLPPSILKRANVILEIPMYGAKESLNVAVAFGIVVYALIKHK